MAEQQAEAGSAAQAGIEATELKTVLVCLGEHRRAVTFTSNGRKGDAKALLEAAGRVFSDVLDLQDDKQVLLQTQSHIWSGELRKRRAVIAPWSCQWTTVLHLSLLPSFIISFKALCLGHACSLDA